MEAAGLVNLGPFAGFQRAFFSKLVPNVRKLGLLDANDGYLRQQWGEAGLLEFEFADDTATDFESYDAVAADRAAARTPSLPGGAATVPVTRRRDRKAGPSRGFGASDRQGLDSEGGHRSGTG